MDVETGALEKLNGFKEFLCQLAQSASPISEPQDAQRLKDGLDFMFADSHHDAEKFQCLALILTLEPSILKPKLKELVQWTLAKGGDPAAASLMIDFLKAYSRMRKIIDFLRVYISCVTESEATFVGTEEELRCLESIFVDVSHGQCIEAVQLILESLEKLMATDSEDQWKTAIKLSLMLRSIVFSSPALVHHRSISEKLIIDLAELLKKSKKADVEYRRVVADILMEMVVKVYLAISIYEKCETVDLDQLIRSFPKKSMGLPWKLLLRADDKTIESSKVQHLISKYINISIDHDCDVVQDELGVTCLPAYCLVDEFWKKFLSNFSLFRQHVDDTTIKKMIEFLRQDKWKDQNSPLRQSIIDFSSVFDVNIDQPILDSAMDYEVAIPEKERAENEAAEALKSEVIEAMTKDLNGESLLKSMFDSKSMISDPADGLRQLQMTAFAFGHFETSKTISDDVKTFFKEFSNRLYVKVPILISKNWKGDISMTVKIVARALDVFARILADKALDLPKYPSISVALTCASMMPWDRIRSDHVIDFRKAFESFLKLLQTGMKRCNNLVINMAPNWMGILRRMQAILFELSIGTEAEDWTPLYHRLGRFYSTLDRSKELEKIVVFVIYDLVDCLRKKKLSDAQKDALESGVYHMMGISDSYSVAMITAMMDDTSKELFRVMYENYVKYYKYTGQV